MIQRYRDSGIKGFRDFKGFQGILRDLKEIKGISSESKGFQELLRIFEGFKRDL